MQMSSSEEARDFINMVGVKDALRLTSYRRFIYIPQKPNMEITNILGSELAKTVCYNFGGIYISLPLEKLRMSIRNDAIIKCYEAEVRLQDISAMFKLSRQAVYKIIKKHNTGKTLDEVPCL